MSHRKWTWSIGRRIYGQNTCKLTWYIRSLVRDYRNILDLSRFRYHRANIRVFRHFYPTTMLCLSMNWPIFLFNGFEGHKDVNDHCRSAAAYEMFYLQSICEQFLGHIQTIQPIMLQFAPLKCYYMILHQQNILFRDPWFIIYEASLRPHYWSVATGR